MLPQPSPSWLYANLADDGCYPETAAGVLGCVTRAISMAAGLAVGRAA